MLFLNKQLIFILFCTIVPKANGVDEESPIMTYRPIIGVMSIDISHGWIKWFPNKTQSIAASYIKIVETGGARAVPILCNQTDEYYEKMFQSTNGLLIPGGGVSLDTSCYAQVGRTMIQKALNSGDYYPIWGTCLGFELILHILDDNRPNLSKCYSKNVSLPLYFDDDYLNKSRIGQAMPKQMKHILSTENVTSNFHKKCITIQTFYEHNLDTIWYPLSTSYDESGLEFISLIEAKNYAFWGSQFHPEKTMFEWSPRINTHDIHSPQSILASQFFANFFVQECRKNEHRFKSREEEENYLISNYDPFFTGNHERDLIFSEAYLFD
uniref:folate gamma-glutamyl hydrolase n=2 Tax=Lepeophtheirus salmonis TaxID=72036 RepID=A0A0K2U1H6_LEPSM